MSSEPKKRGRPKKNTTESTKTIKNEQSSILSLLTDEQKRQLVAELSKELGIQPNEEVQTSSRKAKFIKNKFIDDGTQFKNETEEFTKKVKFNVSPRGHRKPPQKKCDNCGKMFDSGGEDTCNDCILNKGRF